jgi:hypothetical protein
MAIARIVKPEYIRRAMRSRQRHGFEVQTMRRVGPGAPMIPTARHAR